MSIRSAFGSRDRIVVVGAGAAGIAAATHLRRLGFAGHLAVLGAEAHHPYERPACSKGLLSGRRRPNAVALPPPAARIGLCPATAVVSADLAGRTVTIETGQTIDYDGIVVASGTSAAVPNWWPRDAEDAHLVHSLDDATALREALCTPRRATVIGGGLTGCEVAGVLHAGGHTVTIVDPHHGLMRSALGRPVADLVTKAYAAMPGIELALGHRVHRLVRIPDGWRVVLDNGVRFTTEVVIGAFGERPDVGWLTGNGLDLHDGVLCDRTLRIVGADAAVACGSVARWPNPLYDRGPARIAHWVAAMELGRAAAGTLLSGRGAEPAAVLPRFWSYQGNLRIQVAGIVDRCADVQLTRTAATVGGPGVLARYHDQHGLAGLVAVNAAHAFVMAGRDLVRHRGRPAAASPIEPWINRGRGLRRTSPSRQLANS